VIVVIVGWRILFEATSRAMGPRERLLLVGTNPAAVAWRKSFTSIEWHWA
jgi:hypothetical protein